MIPAVEAVASRRGVFERRIAGDYEIDEWGLDADLVRTLSPLAALRWAVDVEGGERIPEVGGALLVHNRRVGMSEPFVVSRGVRLATGRFLRPLGLPDVAPVGPALRRLGAAVNRPEEMAGLLRAGHLVALSLDRSLRHRSRAGGLHPQALTPAVAAGVPVLPVAVVGRELGRSWRVEIGEPLEAPAGGGPLAAAELADGVRAAVQRLLDERLPPRWPFD